MATSARPSASPTRRASSPGLSPGCKREAWASRPTESGVIQGSSRTPERALRFLARARASTSCTPASSLDSDAVPQGLATRAHSSPWPASKRRRRSTLLACLAASRASVARSISRSRPGVGPCHDTARRVVPPGCLPMRARQAAAAAASAGWAGRTTASSRELG